MALLRASEGEGPDHVAVFWQEVDDLRDMFKFEFFYAPTEEFHQQIREEVERYSPEWEELLSQGATGFTSLLAGMTPLVAHVTLLTYAEAYSVVAAVVARLEPGDSMDKDTCVSEALKYGRQAYLQRRISSESSIGKLLFSNGFKMMESRELTAGGGPEIAEKRMDMARELRELMRRIDVIRAIGVASRGAL